MKSSTIRPSHRATSATRRWGAASAALTVVAGTVLIATTSVASAEVVTYNPFDVNQGFTVLAQGDAVLGNAELEGAIAAYGSIRSTKQNYPVIHTAAGLPDYTIPVIDGSPVRILAGSFAGGPDQWGGETGFAITNRDDSGTVPAGSNETKGIAKLVDTTGLTFAERGGFTRITNAGGSILDLEDLPYSASAQSLVQAEQPSVASYFGDVAGEVAQTNECLGSMYDDEELAHEATVGGDPLTLSDFDTTMPNWIDYSSLGAGGTVKLSPAAGQAGSYVPSAQAPLIIRVPAGTTSIGPIDIEGWSPHATQQQDYARYIMVDLSQVTGSVSISGLTMGALWAPDANLNFDSGVTTNGQWIAQDVTTAGGGEIHQQTFGGLLRCGDSDGPTVTTSTETSDTTTSDTSDTTTSDTTTSDTTTSDTTTSDTSDTTTSDTTTSDTSDTTTSDTTTSDTSDTTTSDTTTSDTTTSDTTTSDTTTSDTTTSDTTTSDTTTSDTTTSDTTTSDTTTTNFTPITATVTTDTSATSETSDTTTSDTTTSDTITSDTITSDTSGTTTSDTTTSDTTTAGTTTSGTTTADTTATSGTTTTGGTTTTASTTGTTVAVLTTASTVDTGVTYAGNGGGGGGSLANTGFDVTRWVALGLILVGAGAALSLLRRQRAH